MMNNYPKLFVLFLTIGLVMVTNCVDVPSSQIELIPARLPGACNANKWCWEHPTPSGNALLGVFGTSQNNVWAVGEGGTLLHYDGQSWLPDRQSGLYPNLNAVYGFAPNDLWAVGDKSTVLRYDGISWKEEKAVKGLFTGPIRIKSIWGTSSKDVWLGFESAFLAHYDGTTWRLEAGIANPSYQIQSLYGFSKNDRGRSC